MLVSKKKHVARASKNQNNILEQELTNIILRKIYLKTLSGYTKRYCQKGRDLEKTYSSHIMLDFSNNNFPIDTNIG